MARLRAVERREVAADLVVGADGIRSRVRALLAPAVVPNYGGYVAWRGIMDETDLSAAFMAETFDRFSFCFPPGGQFIGYPLLGQDGSTAPGARRYNFLWYTHVAGGDDLEGLMTDESGERHEFDSAAADPQSYIEALRQSRRTRPAAAICRGGACAPTAICCNRSTTSNPRRSHSVVSR